MPWSHSKPTVKFYQAIVVVFVAALLWALVNSTANWYGSNSQHLDTGYISIDPQVLRQINLYSHIEDPIETEALLEIAQQEFEKQKLFGSPIENIEAEYLLTLVESNLLMSRYQQAEDILDKIELFIENIPTDNALNQQLKLQYFMMKIWLNADRGSHQQAKVFLTLAEQTPVDAIVQQEVFWQLEVTKCTLYLQLGMFEELITKAEHLLPIFERHHDRETSILIARLYDVYSTALRQLDQNKAAIEALKKATEWDKRVFSDNHSVSGARLTKLAVIYTMEGQYRQAIEHFEEGLAIYHGFEKPNYFVIALAYSNMSVAQFELEQTENALNSIDTSINLAKLHLDNSGGIDGYFHLIKAGHQFHLKNYSQTKLLLDIATPIIESRTAQNHPAQARLLLLKTQLSRETGDFDSCNHFGQLAIEKYQQIFKQPQHWEQNFANMSKISCQLIDGAVSPVQYQKAMAQIKQTHRQLITKYNENALQVRKFERGLGLAYE